MKMAWISAKSTTSTYDVRILKYVSSSVALLPCITGSEDNQFRFKDFLAEELVLSIFWP